MAKPPKTDMQQAISIFVVLLNLLERIETNMATEADLDAAIDALKTAFGTVAAEIAAAFARLEAKIGTQPELQDEIDNLNAQITAMNALAETAKGKGV